MSEEVVRILTDDLDEIALLFSVVDARDKYEPFLISVLRQVADSTNPLRLYSPDEAINPNRKIFEARKRETAALGAGEKLVLGHPLAATIGDSARCMQNLEKVLFTGPKTSDTVTFICD